MKADRLMFYPSIHVIAHLAACSVSKAAPNKQSASHLASGLMVSKSKNSASVTSSQQLSVTRSTTGQLLLARDILLVIGTMVAILDKRHFFFNFGLSATPTPKALNLLFHKNLCVKSKSMNGALLSIGLQQ
jgi:hypothetical protein